MTGYGDRLARGARSATYGPITVSQDKWDSMWADDGKENTETKKVILKKKNGKTISR